jgi:protein TonB
VDPTTAPEKGTATGLGDGPQYITAAIDKPVLISKVEPEYPFAARRMGLGGRVTVSAVIGLDGSVESAEILGSSNPLFDQAALEAVRRWRYRAATMNGQPVRVFFTVRVDFVVR